MTRFWITLDQSVKIRHPRLDEMHGESDRERTAPALVSEDEARSTVGGGGHVKSHPTVPSMVENSENWGNAKALPEGFRYASDTKATWLSNEQLQELIAPYVLTSLPFRHSQASNIDIGTPTRVTVIAQKIRKCSPSMGGAPSARPCFHTAASRSARMISRRLWMCCGRTG